MLSTHVSPGVWPEGSDGTDINALVRSHNRRVIAVADDFCKVHLFQYPCSKAKVSSAPQSLVLPYLLGVSVALSFLADVLRSLVQFPLCYSRGWVILSVVFSFSVRIFGP